MPSWWMFNLDGSHPSNLVWLAEAAFVDQFRRWCRKGIPKLNRTSGGNGRSARYGGKPLVAWNGEPLFAEAAGTDGPVLRKLKSALSSWAQANDVVILDGGRSEHTGCDVSEFVDAHHTLASCFKKVFASTQSRME